MTQTAQPGQPIAGIPPGQPPIAGAVPGQPPTAGAIRPLPAGLTPPDLTDAYRRMTLVRAIDERIWMMNRQGKVPIAASGQGHEAAQLGSLVAAEKDGNCFLFPYYRDLSIKMSVGLTPTQVMLSFMGKAGDPYSNAPPVSPARGRPET